MQNDEEYARYLQDRGSSSSEEEAGFFNADANEISNTDLNLQFNQEEMKKISELVFDE